MISDIVEQKYPCLCLGCIRKDGRKDLEHPKVKEQLILFSIGRESSIKEADIKKYSMTWNDKLRRYECDKHPELIPLTGDKLIFTAPDIPVKLFWCTCSKCGTKQLNTEDQEKYLQKITEDRVFVEEPVREIKTIYTVETIENPDQQKTTCLKCGHSGLQFNEDKF